MRPATYIFILVALSVLLGVSLFSERVVIQYISEDEGVASGSYMTITAYSEKDSCHYRVKDGCLTASQEIADYGTIACPRDWKLGTIVFIESEFFKCSDRYNKNLSDRIDMWVGYGEEAHTLAQEFGVKTLKVEIIHDPQN